MLRKRIIFTLIYADNNFNQSRNFRLQKVGDVNWLERNYKFTKIAHSIDELIIVNATRGEKSLTDFASVLKKIVSNIFIPICAGGGINSIEDAKILFNNGADKIIINSLLYKSPEIVKQLVKIYGSQSIVASIDYLLKDSIPEVYIENGLKKIEFNLIDYIEYVQSLHVGEIYLNSINQDGTGFGYDIDTLNLIRNKLNVPLIIAGGAGNEKHLLEGISQDEVSAVATANLFNFMGNGLPLARNMLLSNNINLANWQDY
jgi:cyclase